MTSFQYNTFYDRLQSRSFARGLPTVYKKPPSHPSGGGSMTAVPTRRRDSVGRPRRSGWRQTTPRQLGLLQGRLVGVVLAAVRGRLRRCQRQWGRTCVRAAVYAGSSASAAGGGRFALIKRQGCPCAPLDRRLSIRPPRRRPAPARC